MLPTRCGHCKQIVTGSDPHHCEYCGAPIENVNEYRYDTRTSYFGRGAYSIWSGQQRDTPAVYFAANENHEKDSRVSVQYTDDGYVNNLKAENERLINNQWILNEELTRTKMEFYTYKKEHELTLANKIFAAAFLAVALPGTIYTILHLLGWT